MNIRFYIDSETALPHIYGHQVDEREVEDVLREPGEEPDSVFVITAYQLTGKALLAYRRRRRRK